MQMFNAKWNDIPKKDILNIFRQIFSELSYLPAEKIVQELKLLDSVTLTCIETKLECIVYKIVEINLIFEVYLDHCGLNELHIDEYKYFFMGSQVSIRIHNASQTFYYYDFLRFYDITIPYKEIISFYERNCIFEITHGTVGTRPLIITTKNEKNATMLRNLMNQIIHHNNINYATIINNTQIGNNLSFG